MNDTLEIPFRPGWPAPGEARVQPPSVPLRPSWEYKEIVRETAAGSLSESELNGVGAEGWELAGVVPTGDRVHFYFKRERHR